MYGTHFCDWVNLYRIEAAKKMLSEQKVTKLIWNIWQKHADLILSGLFPGYSKPGNCVRPGSITTWSSPKIITQKICEESAKQSEVKKQPPCRKA